MKNTQNLLRQLGIHATHKGYHYLLTAMEMALEDESNLRHYTKMLFPTVARNHHTTPSRVERDIRTVIAHCWECPGKEKLLEITPYHMQHQPTIGEFLDIVYWHLKFIENDK